MKVLQELATSQTLSFIPRVYPSFVNYTLTNESTNTSVSKENVETSTNSGYLQISDIFDLKEGNFYNIVMYKTVADDFEKIVLADNGIYEPNSCFNAFAPTSTKLIYKGRIFCTNQTDLEKYTNNNNVYTENTTYDNEFVIYEG